MQLPTFFRSGTSREAAHLNLSAEEPTSRAEVRTLTGFLSQPPERDTPETTTPSTGTPHQEDSQ